MEINPNIISKYKVSLSPTLWDISQDTLFRALRLGVCPYCACKLYQMKNGNWRCKSVRHKKPFIIREKRLKEINGK